MTLTPREVSVLSDKKWIEGQGRYGQKSEKGIRAIVLLHVTLLVPMKPVLTLLKRSSSKQIRASNLKAACNYTWRQVGPTSFMPHYQRSAAYADNANRIGVVQA